MMFFNKNILRATHSFEGFELWDFIIPALRYLKKKDLIKYALTPQTGINSIDNIRVKGYKGMETEWNNDLETAKKKMIGYNIKIDKKVIQDFEKYLADCNENNTKVILVFTPEYIEGQKFVTNRQAVMNVFKNLSNKYKVPFYDYSNDSISYHRNYFYNAEHLNKTGSTLFTKLFIADLKRDNQVLGFIAQRRTAVMQ